MVVVVVEVDVVVADADDVVVVEADVVVVDPVDTVVVVFAVDVVVPVAVEASVACWPGTSTARTAHTAPKT